MRVNIKIYELRVCGIHIEVKVKKSQVRVTFIMNSWFLLFENLCHNNVQETIYCSWTINQGMAESSSPVGGGSRKLDSYKVFREICFVAHCRTFYTPYQFNFQRQRQP